MARGRWVAVLLAAEVGVIAAVYLHACGGHGFPLDDSWIYAVFARNLADGKGLSYNPGQHVSPTGMLYALLLGALYRIVPDPVAAAVALGIVLHIGASVLVYLAARELGLCQSTAAVVGLLLFAAIPRLIWGALSGMEVPLYVFLIALGLYWQIRYRPRDGSRSYLATLAFALATLARPECGAFLVASMVHRTADAGKGGAVRYLRSAPLHLLLFALVLTPWAVFNLCNTGLPLPPAFYAKTAHLAHRGLVHATVVAPNCVWQAVRVCARDNVVLALGSLFGAVACSRRSRALLLPLAFVIPPILAGLLAQTGTGRAQLGFQTGRYSAYLVPVFVLMAAVGFDELRRCLSRSRGRVALPALVAMACGVAALNNAHMVARYALDVRSINSMQVAIGKWAAHLPRGTTLAVNDAGAIAYFSRKRIIDTVGVVNPEVLPYLSEHTDRQVGLWRYLVARKPDCVVIFPEWYPRIAARADVLRPVKVIGLKHDTVCGGDTMVVYRTAWGRVASTEANDTRPLTRRRYSPAE